MPTKTIIEMDAEPGQRNTLLQTLKELHEKRRNAPGFVSCTYYEVIDDADKIIEITEWESAEARQAWLEQTMSSGIFQRLIETLKHPFKAVTIRPIE